MLVVQDTRQDYEATRGYDVIKRPLPSTATRGLRKTSSKNKGLPANTSSYFRRSDRRDRVRPLSRKSQRRRTALPLDTLNTAQNY